MNKTIRILAWISIIAGLTSCSTGIVPPKKGMPTMEESYMAAQSNQATFHGNGTDNADQTVMPMNLPNMTEGAKTAFTSVLDSQFPALANPQSLMYIFGHYAGDEQIPVPGHFTAFPLYMATYYALPDEIQRPYNDGQTSSGDQND